MEIKKIKIDKLKHAEYNPRIDLQSGDAEYEKIKKSINTFGYVEPVIVNSDYTIIGGHQRTKVLKDLGYKEIDCVIVSLDKDNEKALNIALNKIDGKWDMGKLQEVLEELNNTDIDLELTGFDEEELNNILDQMENEFEEEEEKYTSKTDSLTYEKQEDQQPKLKECFDISKTNELLDQIDSSEIKDEEIKNFLKFCTYRHIKFNYERIAEYYCHANKEIQELMENSALIIIDYEKSIELGYTNLKESLLDLQEKEEQENE